MLAHDAPRQSRIEEGRGGQVDRQRGRSLRLAGLETTMVARQPPKHSSPTGSWSVCGPVASAVTRERPPKPLPHTSSALAFLNGLEKWNDAVSPSRYACLSAPSETPAGETSGSAAHSVLPKGVKGFSYGVHLECGQWLSRRPPRLRQLSSTSSTSHQSHQPQHHHTCKQQHHAVKYHPGAISRDAICQPSSEASIPKSLWNQRNPKKKT